MRPQGRRLRRFLIVLVVAGLAGAAAGVIHAAFFATTDNTGSAFDAGSVVLTDNDSNGAALTLTAANPGATDTGCIRLAYTGSLDSTVRHYADVTGALAPYLTLKVTRGTDSSPAFRSCTNFTADSNDYNGQGAGVLYDGLLSTYPTTYAGGIVDPSSGGIANYASTITGTSGILGYWRLDPTFVSDTMADTTGTLLQAHTGQLGAAWTKHAAATADAIVTDENRIRKNGTNTQMALYYTSGVPATADYAVEADFHVKSLLANDYESIVGRLDTAVGTGTYYMARYNVTNTRWELLRVNTGTLTSLGTFTQTLTVGNTYRLRLDMQGTAIKLFVDGVQRISVVNANIVAAGRAGVRLGTTVNTTITNTTGIHLANFAAYDLRQTDSVGTNHGTANNQPANSTGAIPGDANGSLTFDGTDDYVSVARQISDDFTLEFWFKSTQGLNTNAQWWGNAGLVDGEVNAGGNDFGTSLRSDGRIVAGTGAPDTSVVTTGSYNDGRWHYVAFTRTGSTGAMEIYVDGVLDGSVGAGPTQALVGPANIHFGKIQGGTNYYAGQLDEVAIYNTALSPATVAAHYATVRVPEIWTNPEYHSYKLEITLANTNAIEGLAATSTFRWEARNQ